VQSRRAKTAHLLIAIPPARNPSLEALGAKRRALKDDNGQGPWPLRGHLRITERLTAVAPPLQLR